MMKCQFCTMRMGKILNLEEVENWTYVPDSEFCKWKKGEECVNPTQANELPMVTP